jgi:hypothetical protein
MNKCRETKIHKRPLSLVLIPLPVPPLTPFTAYLFLSKSLDYFSEYYSLTGPKMITVNNYRLIEVLK